MFKEGDKTYSVITTYDMYEEMQEEFERRIWSNVYWTSVRHMKEYHFNLTLPLSSPFSSTFLTYLVCNQAIDLVLCSVWPKYSQSALFLPYPLPLSSLLRHSWTSYPGNLCNPNYLDLQKIVNYQRASGSLLVLLGIVERLCRILSNFKSIHLNFESFELWEDIWWLPQYCLQPN